MTNNELECKQRHCDWMEEDLKEICTHLQEFLAARQIGKGGEKVDKVVIDYAAKLENDLADAKSQADRWHSLCLRMRDGWESEDAAAINAAIKETSDD